jgi:hypothetical protein
MNEARAYLWSLSAACVAVAGFAGGLIADGRIDWVMATLACMLVSTAALAYDGWNKNRIK